MSVTKTTLDNGLTVLLKEMHHAPVACFTIWYKVGSRNEVPGITGASHWVEHMMFKGTPSFPNGQMDRLISREGGTNNAFTWIDYTAYYETVPSAQLDLALHIEADRMVNTFMTADEVETERSVILSERQMYENDPQFVLDEEMTAVSFRIHPYHHEILGDVPDLRAMTRQDLFNHYRRYYVPNNAVVVVVGDFETAVLQQKIQHQFGQIPAGQPAVPILRQEPAQKGERRLIVTGADQTPHVVFAFRAPAANDPDYIPFALLNAAFAGGSSLGMFGSGGSNKSSRLYQALVDTELAVSAHGSLTPTIDPFLYTISAVVREGQPVQAVDEAMNRAINQLIAHPITEAELSRALKRARAEFVMAGESMTGQAQLLGMAEVVAGDYGWVESFLERLTAVSLQDIEQVCARYLRRENRVVGWYVPERGSGGAGEQGSEGEGVKG